MQTVKRAIIAALAAALCVGVMAGCSKQPAQDASASKGGATASQQAEAKGTKDAKPGNTAPLTIKAPTEPVAEGYVAAKKATNYVDILMDDGKHIVIELKPQNAPMTVKNFQKLVGEGFYNGLTFHRVIDGFMIQGGDPKGDGTGGSGTTIVGEFAQNGIPNALLHKRGTVSMARSQNPDSASSQFFICNADSGFLDGQYAAFGVVISGMEEVDRIAKLEKGPNDRPVNPPVMKQVAMVQPK